MIYRCNSQSVVRNLGGLIFFLLLWIIALFLFIDNPKAIIAITVISFALMLPQVFLAIQYKKNIRYRSIEIDYANELFVIDNTGKVITKRFSTLKTVQYHKANVPVGYLSLAFNLCEYFYYYRFEFIDGEIYYITNLSSPPPIIDDMGVFYPYFIKVDRKYATIK